MGSRYSADRETPKGVCGSVSSYQSWDRTMTLAHGRMIIGRPGSGRGRKALGAVSGVLILRTKAVSCLERKPQTIKVRGLERNTNEYTKENRPSGSQEGDSNIQKILEKGLELVVCPTMDASPDPEDRGDNWTATGQGTAIISLQNLTPTQPVTITTTVQGGTGTQSKVLTVSESSKEAKPMVSP